MGVLSNQIADLRDEKCVEGVADSTTNVLFAVTVLGGLRARSAVERLAVFRHRECDSAGWIAGDYLRAVALARRTSCRSRRPPR